MKIKRRNFSLLEVLISIMLITAFLPFLLTPFFYASKDISESVKRMNQEKMLGMLVTLLFADLHTGVIPLNALDSGEQVPFKPEWKVEGTYQFKGSEAKETEEEAEAKPKMRQLVILLNEGNKMIPHTYDFIVKPK